ncbi:MAG: cytochrome c [Zoogloeaceae bacterium]|jgi:cytochrome c556|nr:cytochrome c [Zoogloeaceae bacterium]
MTATKSFSLFLCSALCLLLAACGPVEDTRPGQPVAHRQQAFKDILLSFEPMGIQLREQHYEAESFLKYAQELEQKEASPWAFFGPETDYPPSKSTPAVWEKPDAFAAERGGFETAVHQLLAAAESRELTQIQPAYQAVQEHCRSCHKAFRK